MIKTEFYTTRADGVKLYRTYSTLKYRILQNDTNITYDEAIDVENSPHTYSETDIPIESDELTEDEEYTIAGKILMGDEE